MNCLMVLVYLGKKVLASSLFSSNLVSSHGVIFHCEKCLLLQRNKPFFKRKSNFWQNLCRKNIECARFFVNSIPWNSKRQARNFKNHLKILKDLKNDCMHGETSFLFFKIFRIVERIFKIAGAFFQVQPISVMYL